MTHFIPSSVRTFATLLSALVGWCSIQPGNLAAAGSAAPKESESQLIAVLQSSAAPAEKAISCKKLAVVGGKDAVPALAPLLADPDLSSWARIALQAIPGPEAEDALREALGHVKGRLLVGVINSIAMRQDAKAVGGLSAKLKEADADVASAAAEALGRIGGAEAAQTLEAALSSSPSEVRSSVAEGCIICADTLLRGGGDAGQAMKLFDAVRQAEVPKHRKVEATRGAILARKSAGIPLLLEQLKSPDRDSFDVGLSTARELAGRDVTEALAAELPKTSEERQPFVLLALADRHDPAAMPALLGAAKSGAKPVRLTAIGILERSGNLAAIPLLLVAAGDADVQVSQGGKLALARIEGPGIDAELSRAIGEATGASRLALIEVAGQRRMTSCLPTVARAAQDTDPAVRRAAIESLGAIGDEHQVGDLVAQLGKTNEAADREAIRKALTAICGRAGARCVPALLPLAGHADSVLRMMGLHLLSSVGGPESLAAVTKAVSDRDEAVQDDAVSLLATWPNNWPDDVAVAEPLLDLAKSGKKPAHQVQGIRGYLDYVQESKQLSPADKAAKIKALLPLIQRPEEKRLAIAALGSIPAAASLDVLTTLATDRAVAEEACLALGAVASNKNLKDASKEQCQKALQTVLDQSQNAATKKKAEEALKAL